MSKFSKKKKDTPAINTSALPDIVFMLLFFFMVATTMRETSPEVKAEIPNATEVKKLKNKKLIRTIYVGEAVNQKKYGEGDKIQLNDKISSIKEVKNFIYNSIDKLDDKADAPYMTTLIKADKKANVGTISDIKRELRDVNALKVTYATKTGDVSANVK